MILNQKQTDINLQKCAKTSKLNYGSEINDINDIICKIKK